MSLWRDTVLGVTTQPAVQEFVVSHALARPLRERFVAGETLPEALAATRGLNAAGFRVSLDHLGEDVRDAAAADAAVTAYEALVAAMEDEFGVMIDTEDVIDMSSFDKAREILAKQGIRFDE